MFDITFCKCTNFDACKCQKDKKIPLAERLFINDQILERKMVIGKVDVIATERRKKEKRKQMEDKRIKRKMVKTDADAAHAQSMGAQHYVFVLVYRYGCNYLEISIIKLFRFPYLSNGM
ncbi:hypothetical protein AVEN_249105-1 [Araneus ventricosus]|uniref:Uncharacterized protein n=1 Tax=Araneus ventricosus TaxID=182803 RepID=A0A4Y2NRN2_ARAVE|nr:hypothetical protein AVEN_249105-1 [Araneus ventricosus]